MTTVGLRRCMWDGSELSVVCWLSGERPPADGGAKILELDKTAYDAGQSQARSDIAAGRLVYRWSVNAGHWGYWIVTQLAEQYGVEVSEGFGVCFVDSVNNSFNQGYNKALGSELAKRFGPAAIERIFAESREQSEEDLYSAKRRWLDQHGSI